VARALREKHGIRTTNDNKEACRAGNVVLVCVKPHEVGPLLSDPELAALLAGKLVISIAAGIRLDQLSRWLPKSAVVRAMPNTPV
jgi:pyrroline-5-carboxylate reductase